MAVWTVWEHDRHKPDTRKAERAIFVRDGFSCLATLFGPFWLLARGMVVVLIAYLVLVGAANWAAAEQFGEQAAFLISAVLTLWFGFEATALRRWSLARRGWQLVAVVEAGRLVEAERRYYENRPEADTGRATPPPLPTMMQPWPPRQPPVLGLFPDHPR